ncbi:transcriptional protein SWT1-like [Stegodyphus dumicola]|uniref:transcriptional protein SWT1-like n=1 Tax=Stegodyphus dumicola TaxID=202533 RepID=UPI0015AC159D|nr:transcriptional protein SWT1-like [Stegodyphus dumicola]XP_035220430.1 transcriptional protein SWT1-like [Stegodyphus dumicola]XP_035220431.1 transcriptional protein SWT1-like [Stegodyphus dumicola]XP_035220432.1 transcriptional protein SWT1-like [Stegodyphus dumicola]XP_035220433.1 transcriptional protein SWT1-like [Stegodyphus dumicola]XP_035220434.1 transcriptional protein SWT1-like [Stegodyphus dumicola]
MEQNAVKSILPSGWIVASSKRYPDRVYYFNVITGASSWECPVLNSSSVQTTKAECYTKEPVSIKRPYEMTDFGKNAESFKTTKDLKKCSRNLLPEFKTLKRSRKGNAEEESLCASVPPTAVVNPVVNERYANSPMKPVSSLPIISDKSEHKKLMRRSKKKRRRLRQEEKERNAPSVCDVLALNTADQVNKLNLSVLEPQNKAQNDDLENLSSITNETDSGFIEDIEMLDVSEDLTKIEDLSSDEACSDGFISYYIVVDTNVFIQELKFIDEIKDTPIEGCGPPHIFIPWVVIQELDSLKRSNKATSGRKAIEAVRYLNSVLIAKHPRFHGQSAKEFEEWSQKYSKCNDDRILECCVSLAEKMPREKVILLTHDKNLVNKALVCDIVVHNLESMMKALKPDVIYKGVRDNSPNSQRKAIVKGSNILVSLVPGEVGSSESQVSRESESTEKKAKKKLRKQQDLYKRKIHSHMSTARQLLKDALEPFLEAEMNEAYGEAW